MLIMIILINIEITINYHDYLLILTKTIFLSHRLIITAFTSILTFLPMYNYVHRNKIGRLIHQNSVHLLKEKIKIN